MTRISADSQAHSAAYRDDFIEGNGTFIIAIGVVKFVEVDGFRREVDGLFTMVKSVPCDDETEEVMIPGEIEFRTRRQRERDGIPFSQGTWQTIADTARDLGVTISPVR